MLLTGIKQITTIVRVFCPASSIYKTEAQADMPFVRQTGDMSGVPLFYFIGFANKPISGGLYVNRIKPAIKIQMSNFSKTLRLWSPHDNARR